MMYPPLPTARVTRRRGPKARPTLPRTLVVGLGNPIAGDDGVGLRVAALLVSRLAGTGVDVVLDTWGGLRLMERMVGYERAVVVDAACTGAPPGTVRRMPCGEATTRRSASAHDVDLATALRFGRRCGAKLPDDRSVLFVAVEAGDVWTFSETCSPPVAAAIPRAARLVERLVLEPRKRPLG